MRKLLLSIFTITLSTSAYFSQCNVTINADKIKFCSDEKGIITAKTADLKTIPDFSDSKEIFNIKSLGLNTDILNLIKSGVLTNISYPIKDTVKGSFNMPIPGVELKTASVTTGKLKLALETDLKQNFKIYFQLPYFKINGKPLTDSIIIEGNKIAPTGLIQFSKDIDLKNAVVDFTAGNPTQYNTVYYKVLPAIRITTNIITGNEVVNMKLSLSNLTFTENIKYEWFLDDTSIKSENTPSIEVNKGGTYKVKTTSNCGTGEKSIQITVNPNPVVKLNHVDTTIVIGSKLTLKATGAKEYLWNDKSILDSIVLKEAGKYSVTGKNEYGCTDSAIFELKLREKGLGIETLNTLHLSISPNPVSDILTVTVDSFKNNSLSIVDLKGNKILTKLLTDSKTEINVNSFAKGIYLVNISDNANTVLNTKRFVVE
jgi:hypothetical protein